MPLPAQLTRFIITGGLSAIVDFGLLVILMALGLGHTPAKAISFIAGTTTAYLINRRWTFRASPSTRRFVAVVILYAVTFALQVGLFSVLFTLSDSAGPEPASCPDHCVRDRPGGCHDGQLHCAALGDLQAAVTGADCTLTGTLRRVASAEHPKSLDVCAAQAAPRCVLVVAHRTAAVGLLLGLAVHPPWIDAYQSRDFECTSLVGGASPSASSAVDSLRG